MDYDRDVELLALAVLNAAKSTSAQAALIEGLAGRIVDAMARGQAEPEAGSLLRCPHPEDERENAGTMSHPRRFYCKVCREFVDPSNPSAARS